MANPTMVQYQGFEIESESQKLRDQEAWTVNVRIIKHTAIGVNERPFLAKETFPTKAQADAAAIQLGKDIVDGKVPKHSVADL